MFISRLLPPAHKAASCCTYKPLLVLSMRKCRSAMKIQTTSAAGLKYYKCWKCKSVGFMYINSSSCVLWRIRRRRGRSGSGGLISSPGCSWAAPQPDQLGRPPFLQLPHCVLEQVHKFSNDLELLFATFTFCHIQS